MEFKTKLASLGIDTTSRVLAIQDVRRLCDDAADPLAVAANIIITIQPVLKPEDITSVDSPQTARLIAAAMVDYLFQEKFDANHSYSDACTRVEDLRKQHPWMFVIPPVPSISVPVDIQPGDKLKKGQKQILAAQLYTKHKEKTNKELVELFMKELDMSIAGARTYVYGLRAKEKSK